MFPSMVLSPFTYQFISSKTSGLFSFWVIRNNIAMNMHDQILVWT